MKYKFNSPVSVSSTADDHLRKWCNRKARRTLVARLRSQMQATVETIRQDALTSDVALQRFGVTLRHFVVLFRDWLVVLSVRDRAIVIRDFLPSDHISRNPIYSWVRDLLRRNTGLVRLVAVHADDWTMPRLFRIFGMIYRGVGRIRVRELYRHFMWERSFPTPFRFH